MIIVRICDVCRGSGIHTYTDYSVLTTAGPEKRTGKCVTCDGKGYTPTPFRILEDYENLIKKGE